MDSWDVGAYKPTFQSTLPEYALYDGTALEGVTVICRSNEDEPYMIGELVGFTTVATSRIPLVKVGNGDNEQTFMVMGVVLPYSQTLADTLDGLDHTEQWEFCKQLTMFCRHIDREKNLTSVE